MAASVPLTVDGVLQRKPDTIITELAPGSAKVAAEDYVARLRRSDFPSSVIAAQDENGEHLPLSAIGGRNFLLFGTISGRSKLLSRMLGDAGIRVSSNTVTVQGETIRCPYPRIIFTWTDKKRGTRGVVFAAKANSFLPKIYDLDAGAHSFYIYDSSDNLLFSGMYDEDYNFVDETFTVAQSYADISQFFGSLEANHPDLLSKMPPERYMQLKDWVFDQAARRNGANGISRHDLAYILYYAAAQFRDGHTSVYWTIPPDLLTGKTKAYPPFAVKYDNGKFVISAARDPSLIGMEITGAEKMPFADFMAPVLDRCSAEAMPFRAWRFASNQGFWWAMSGLAQKALHVSLRARDGKTLEKTLRPVDYAAYFPLVAPAMQEQYGWHGSRVEYLDEGKIADFIYPAFDYTQEERDRVAAIFRDIRLHGSQDLIIDMRGNGGGNSAMGDLIMSYLTEKPFVAVSESQLRITEDSVEQKDAPKAYSSLSGLTITYRNEPVRHEKPETFFNGRVYLLTDNATFSTAGIFAAMFRDYSIGRIIGYETGGLAESFGDPVILKLQNTGIVFGVSCKRFFPPNPRPGDDEHGVMPDIQASDELLSAFKDSPDPLFSFAVSEVKKLRSTPR
jgi:hypothetical protein